MSTITPIQQPTDIGAVVAAELRVLMARYHVTQAALADLIGVSQSQMSKRMKGKIPIDIFELEKLADFFEVSVADLVGGQQKPRPDGGPDGGSRVVQMERARRDSNSQPSDPKVGGSASRPAPTTIPLPMRREPVWAA